MATIVDDSQLKEKELAEEIKTSTNDEQVRVKLIGKKRLMILLVLNFVPLIILIYNIANRPTLKPVRINKESLMYDKIIVPNGDVKIMSQNESIPVKNF